MITYDVGVKISFVLSLRVKRTRIVTLCDQVTPSAGCENVPTTDYKIVELHICTIRE